jgi:Cys-tRNA(Pro) deacylase
MNLEKLMPIKNEKFPATPATRWLQTQGTPLNGHLYPYQDHGGTAHSAQCLGVDEHCIVKTLIMENERRHPLIVLMHGDRQVSTKELARLLGVKTIAPCDPAVAQKHSGYQVGGTSPFGVRKLMPVYMEASILDLPLIYLNGGKRGFLISLTPFEAQRLLNPTLVNIAIED